MSTNLTLGALQGLTAAQLANVILPPNTIGVTSDTGIGKIGDGVTIFSSLNSIDWSGGVSAAAWGSITGTLSAQTDLQSALDLKGNITSQTFITPNIGVATGVSLTATGAIKSSSPTAGIGFITGAGGAQTQATDKSTTVVSNTITTAITLNNAALAAATVVAFTFTNSTIAATDTVICSHQSAGTSGAYTINAFPGAGSAVISVRNNTAGSLSEAIVIRVTIIKSVSN